MQKVCFNMPKFKVTVDGQMFKLTLSGDKFQVWIRIHYVCNDFQFGLV